MEMPSGLELVEVMLLAPNYQVACKSFRTGK